MRGNRTIPSDLLGVVCLVLLTNLFLLVPGLNDTVIRTALGLPLVLFLPGYALTAALFISEKELDGIERVALSFGLNIAIVPLIGLGLNYTPWGIRLFPILFCLSSFTLLMCAIAGWRRKNLPEGKKAFEISFKTYWLALKAEVLEKPESKIDKMLTLLLVLSILASGVTLFYVIVSPKEGEHFTEFYILGPEGMADNYPTEYLLGESRTVIVGIVNHEYRTLNYTMDLRLENVSLEIPEDQAFITLRHNETWERSLKINPPFEGRALKLEFLLFNETEKTKPYRDLHLWINVGEARDRKNESRGINAS
ncbi:MAG: DUF1616 domain-containing protein [Methanosarcinaceae archaeon]|nr:DUF1616 domain-containing protein [Methanosarcinaceae archaeon]MDD4749728.1 DUF1616 domain-containing protein [Methanosarcinaceae archaeon]